MLAYICVDKHLCIRDCHFMLCIDNEWSSVSCDEVIHLAKFIIIWVSTRENLTLLYVKNKGTNCPVHQCSLLFYLWKVQ